jgi:protein O-mannosyl-transferase
VGRPVALSPELQRRLERFAPLLLVTVTALAYLPSLSGGWLNWDDPWLIRDNPLLARSDLGALAAIWTDLSKPTRLLLGAEYLPIRDTELWLEARLFGLSPGPLRATNLALYLGAVLAFRAVLRRALDSRPAAEAASWVFALHPVHVESAAWLAGRKDVLALLFVGAALFVHTGTDRRRVWLVPLLLLAAHLSKAMTVTALGLMFALDAGMKRKPERGLYLAALAAAVIALIVHVSVGRIVGMTEPPAGGSHGAQLATMGPVYLRYLWLMVFPGALSLVQDVPVRSGFDLAAIAGYVVLAGWASAGWLLWRRRGDAVMLSTWLWFVVPLLPVSQLVFPLQNQMADRYLFLSVMAPALLAGWAVRRAPRGALAASGVVVLGLTLATAERSALFGDSVAVFADATKKTRLSPAAPYQLARALEEQGDDSAAIDGYREALRRSGGRGETGRRATNNLAKLYARAGRLTEAEQVLLEGRASWPDDPKILANLAEVVRRLDAGGQRKHAE